MARLRAVDRSAHYGRVIDPPPPSARVLADVAGPKAERSEDHDRRDVAAPMFPVKRRRRPRPRGSL